MHQVLGSRPVQQKRKKKIVVSMGRKWSLNQVSVISFLKGTLPSPMKPWAVCSSNSESWEWHSWAHSQLEPLSYETESSQCWLIQFTQCAMVSGGLNGWRCDSVAECLPHTRPRVQSPLFQREREVVLNAPTSHYLPLISGLWNDIVIIYVIHYSSSQKSATSQDQL